MSFDLVFTGDLVLDEPRPDYWLAGIAPALRAVDVAIGHLEVPHTTHRSEMRSDVPAPGADPGNIPALAHAGFHAVTLAGNHIADCGAIGIADTIAALDAAGIARSGAGADLTTARTPCVIRAPFSSHRATQLQLCWPGGIVGNRHARRMRLRSHRNADGSRIAPASPLERADPASLADLAHDIASARTHNTLVIVALHKGIVHTPARLAPYERAVAHAAIDAGADIVIGHHAHIVRGIEFHRGKPIFHGLGNGCVVTRALNADGDDPVRAAWAQRRQALFGFAPDPAYFLAPFHPEAVNAMLGRVRINDDGSIHDRFRACLCRGAGTSTDC